MQCYEFEAMCLSVFQHIRILDVCAVYEQELIAEGLEAHGIHNYAQLRAMPPEALTDLLEDMFAPLAKAA